MFGSECINVDAGPSLVLSSSSVKQLRSSNVVNRGMFVFQASTVEEIEA